MRDLLGNLEISLVIRKIRAYVGETYAEIVERVLMCAVRISRPCSQEVSDGVFRGGVERQAQASVDVPDCACRVGDEIGVPAVMGTRRIEESLLIQLDERAQT